MPTNDDTPTTLGISNILQQFGFIYTDYDRVALPDTISGMEFIAAIQNLIDRARLDALKRVKTPMGGYYKLTYLKDDETFERLRDYIEAKIKGGE